jgi:hypothetical protein
MDVRRAGFHRAGEEGGAARDYFHADLVKKFQHALRELDLFVIDEGYPHAQLVVVMRAMVNKLMRTVSEQ